MITVREAILMFRTILRRIKKCHPVWYTELVGEQTQKVPLNKLLGDFTFSWSIGKISINSYVTTLRYPQLMSIWLLTQLYPRGIETRLTFLADILSHWSSEINKHEDILDWWQCPVGVDQWKSFFSLEEELGLIAFHHDKSNSVNLCVSPTQRGMRWTEQLRPIYSQLLQRDWRNILANIQDRIERQIVEQAVAVA